MNALLSGFLPVFSLIALGWGLKVARFLPEDGWRPVERLTYFVFYPAFLIPGIWDADFTGGGAGVVALATLAGAMLMALITFLAKPLIKVSDAAYTSVFQGVIPSINNVCVLVLAKWGVGQGGGWRMVGRSLWVNPIIWSCVIGTILNLTGLRPPDILMTPFNMLGEAAIVLGLMVAGAGLSFRDAAGRPVVVGLVTATKLLVLPLIMAWFAILLGADRTALGIVLLAGSAPGAAASYVLARQMGGDAPLMAAVVAFTTLGALFTMPLMLFLFGFL